MAVEFVPIKTSDDQELLAKLAYEIWNEYWPDRIGQAQTDYMVEQFQSLEAIVRQMSCESYEYWFICVPASESSSSYKTAEGKAIVGFTGGHPEEETNRYFISKIYLLKDERGKHYASRVIEHYTAQCQDRGFHAMYLTVNKQNDMAIRAYEAKGFKNIKSEENDIGCGFIMDDYIMEKQA